MDKDKIIPAIEKFIRESYPNVYDVRFGNKKVTLASSPGTPTVDVSLIIIVLDNSDNKMTTGQVYKEGMRIVNTVDGFFGLNWGEYGSGWEFSIAQLHVSKVNM